MFRTSAVLREIRDLDPRVDHERIVHLSTCYEFPFDTTRSLELALFRTFAVPSIGGLLARTGEFLARPQKRYDDTDLIVSELLEYGYSSDRGSRALERMNDIHGRFEISNDDFLYVLSTFIYEPIRWNARFGRRPMCEEERLGMFWFWVEVGRRMAIRDLPDDYDSFARYGADYERRHHRPTEANRKVGEATRELFVGWFPRPIAPLVRSAIHGLLDDEVLDAFSMRRPTSLERRFVGAALRLRGFAARFTPRRRRPRLRTSQKHRTYPDGYVIEKLGPPPADS